MTDEEKEHQDDQGKRMAMGMALSLPLGVVLSVLLDSWAFLGVGIALGAAFGAVPFEKGRPSRTTHDEDG